MVTPTSMGSSRSPAAEDRLGGGQLTAVVDPEDLVGIADDHPLDGAGERATTSVR